MVEAHGPLVLGYLFQKMCLKSNIKQKWINSFHGSFKDCAAMLLKTDLSYSKFINQIRVISEKINNTEKKCFYSPHERDPLMLLYTHHWVPWVNSFHSHWSIVEITLGRIHSHDPHKVLRDYTDIRMFIGCGEKLPVRKFD